MNYTTPLLWNNPDPDSEFVQMFDGTRFHDVFCDDIAKVLGTSLDLLPTFFTLTVSDKKTVNAKSIWLGVNAYGDTTWTTNPDDYDVADGNGEFLYQVEELLDASGIKLSAEVWTRIYITLNEVKTD